MIKKKLRPSPELQLFRSLNLRSSLPPKEKQYYQHLEKGFEGERQFDEWAFTLDPQPVMIHDISFEISHTYCQIDSLWITPQGIYLFEVKQYEGDFYVKDDSWFTLYGKEIKSPLLQLRKNESLLRQLMQQLHWDIPVHAFLIFMNPLFTLYHASPDMPILFPSQTERFHQNWKRDSLPSGEKEERMAEHLLERSTTIPFPSRTPPYTFTDLQKGILCAACFSFMKKEKRMVICPECQTTVSRDQGVLQSVEEFRLLFPDERLTTNTIIEWCGGGLSPRSIRRILTTNFQIRGRGKYASYQ
ncbi:nuclease-related domain-containing protein [Salibacterium halotolerans]|uniref:Nuclease-related domain-containing protein n=1 Tax=Salibacterium halotolerans TaxID=1884432 RepID=A0A1I5W3B4_9BACI|nr:nuclease-related domain-containing protein [Salibacterium halotolerans]SFQ14181.1 Nuclease-related domain-containing protein [Salibacterium halotolerans]